MSTRIEQCFAKTKADKRAALIPFIMGYDPSREATAALLHALAENGADLIEIGMPFSDPMADGPVIQAAGKRALAAGATVRGVLELVAEFRAAHANTPVILMGYYNPIYRYGVERFCADAVKAGVDGIIVVDLPPEEEGEIRPALNASGLKLIKLIAPTSGEARLPMLAASASGFIYYISITGITGAKSADGNALRAQIGELRRHSDLPIAVGFGIKTAAQAKEMAQFADAVVVGSALVDTVSKQATPKHAIQAATEFIQELARALR